MLTRHTVVILLTVYANSEQLCCTPETNIILYVNTSSFWTSSSEGQRFLRSVSLIMKPMDILILWVAMGIKHPSKHLGYHRRPARLASRALPTRVTAPSWGSKKQQHAHKGISKQKPSHPASADWSDLWPGHLILWALPLFSPQTPPSPLLHSVPDEAQ